MPELEEKEKEIIKGELCMFCGTKNLVLSEAVVDIPYFGVTHVFSMNCGKCGYGKSDLETDKKNEPCKFILKIESEDDLKIRVVKSSNATVKIPHIGSIEPGETANGYVTNVEGILNRFKATIESLRDEAEDPADKKKAKNMLKKLGRVMWGRDSVTLTIQDPTGNSAIISDKAEKKKL